jgi:hypothetical protein
MPLVSLRPRLTLSGILTRGYFPPELPPAFQTDSFAAAMASTRRSGLPSDFIKAKNEWCDFVPYSLSRPGSLRRRLAIVNPLPYYRLAKFIVDNQAVLLRKAAESHLSLGKVVVSPGHWLRRANRIEAISQHRATLRVGEHFLLAADVSRFYPSIYTHTIEWAITSRARAKRALRRRKNRPSIGSALDALVQACQSGQTRGIPIGPTASILISEILLTRVDAKLKARKILHGFRYADDYELTFSERSQAERALTLLEDALAEFELELNPVKTAIYELPQELDNPGVQELRKFEFRTRYLSERSDLLQFFTRAFDLQRKFPDKAILRYAVSRLSPATVKTANAALMQALILQAVTYESGVWPMAIDQLRVLHIAQPGTDRSSIGTVIHAMIRKSAPLNHSSEVAWSLWAALIFGLTISKSAVNQVIKMADDCSTLLLLHAAERGLTGTKPRMSSLRRLLYPGVLRGPHWLVAYEALLKGWITPPAGADYIGSDPVFNFLRQHDVHFYDTSEIEEEEEEEEEETVSGYGM